MNQPVSVYTPGVIATIEQFTYAEEDLRQFIVYTYYNQNEEPIYVGSSKSFYNAHHSNSTRLPFFNEVKYIGMIFLESEDEIRDAKKYIITARNPKYNRQKWPSLAPLPGLDPSADSLVVSCREMKPCPKCGSKKVGIDGSTCNREFFVWCDGCWAMGPSADSEYGAIMAWNKSTAEGLLVFDDEEEEQR